MKQAGAFIAVFALALPAQLLGQGGGPTRGEPTTTPFQISELALPHATDSGPGAIGLPSTLFDRPREWGSTMSARGTANGATGVSAQSSSGSTWQPSWLPVIVGGIFVFWGVPSITHERSGNSGEHPYRAYGIGLTVVGSALVIYGLTRTK